MLVATAGANAGQISSVKNAGEQVTICRPVDSSPRWVDKVAGKVGIQTYRGWLVCEPLSRFEHSSRK